MLSAPVKMNFVTFFEDVGEEAYLWLCELAVEVITLDFTRGDSLSLLKTHGFPSDKVLGAGVIDARSPWAMDPSKARLQTPRLSSVRFLTCDNTCLTLPLPPTFT